MITKQLIDKLDKNKYLNKDEFVYLIDNCGEDSKSYLADKALKQKEAVFGKKIYIRGLIEISNYCKNNCFYCGIRRDNKSICRYRLSKEEILECCRIGYDIGFRTFVMQGAEDDEFPDELLIDIIERINEKYPDCAITLSVGEREKSVYQAFYEAGANRYLLRHETADEEHYRKLHPKSMSLKHRKQCLYDLKKIGYQTGTGFMVGSPFQTSTNLADDLLFIKELNPEMVGIGPYISQKDTPFKNQKSGSLEKTLLMLGLVRLMLPRTLIPSTTALGTISEGGREMGLLAGANVIMPNLSPEGARKLYNLYDNKLHTGLEAAEHLHKLKKKVLSVGQEIVTDRGDYK